MTQRVWRICADTLAYKADDMSGGGAKATGGRWNSPGLAIIYASSSIALACLETFVHLNSGGLPLNRYLIALDIPKSVWSAAHVETPTSLPVGWDAEPASMTSTHFGSDWLKSCASAVLAVPSVIVPEETNVLINPEHPDAARITAAMVRKWLYDPRLSRG